MIEHDDWEDEPRERRNGRPRPARAIEDLAEPDGMEAGFQTTYRPSRHEEGWLLRSLKTFYDQNLITDVLAMVNGGKEACVYRCAGHPALGRPLVAAKVYRPRQFRNLRNDALYREGREILTSEGRVVKRSDHRIMRAIGKKTDFGVQARHTSWLMHEFNALQRLRAAGAAVPEPFAANENATLIEYFGDEFRAAPPLIEVAIPSHEAPRLFRDVIHNVELMLSLGWVHGDLSAYNILYWRGRIALIDFPQVTSIASNRNARSILERDVRRVCDYFARHGVVSHADEITANLWASARIDHDSLESE